MSNNNTANVSTAKGVKGGYLYAAPLGTTAPSDYSTTLGAEFKNIGFVSEDGITFSTETDSESLLDMNGDVVDSVKTSHDEKFTVTFAEVKQDALAILYGTDNVSDLAGALTLDINGGDTDSHMFVFEGVLKNGRRWRRIVYNAQVVELGDLAVSAGELFGREATFQVIKDTVTGNFYTDYFQSTETQAS